MKEQKDKCRETEKGQKKRKKGANDDGGPFFAIYHVCVFACVCVCVCQMPVISEQEGRKARENE